MVLVNGSEGIGTDWMSFSWVLIVFTCIYMYLHGEVFILGFFFFFFLIFFLFLVPWSPGPLIPWCPGHLVPLHLVPSLSGPQCPGPLVPWSSGPLVPWSSGPLLLWSSGFLVLCSFSFPRICLICCSFYLCLLSFSPFLCILWLFFCSFLFLVVFIQWIIWWLLYSLKI